MFRIMFIHIDSTTKRQQNNIKIDCGKTYKKKTSKHGHQLKKIKILAQCCNIN